MGDQSTRCKVCNGRGYLRCACWPGDCICGFDDEECEYCDGTGMVYPDDEWEPWEIHRQPVAQEGEDG